jgi:hypothetical protein
LATRHFGYDPSKLAVSTFIPYFYSSVAGAGVYHQLLDNMHRHVTRGVPPPRSNIDSYWVSHNAFPKFPSEAMNQDIYVHDYQPSIDIANYWRFNTDPGFPFAGKGLYRTVVDYLRNNEVLALDFASRRVPEDAARLGLFVSNGFVEYLYRTFTEAELINGFSAGDPNKPLDWDGEPLVTFVLSGGRRVPQDGYRNHGGYVKAVSEAVVNLVDERLYDPYIGSLYHLKAAHQRIPVTVSKNLGQAKRLLEGKRSSLERLRQMEERLRRLQLE